MNLGTRVLLHKTGQPALSLEQWQLKGTFLMVGP